MFVEWHEDDGVAEIRYEDTEISSHEDFERWREAVMKGLGNIRSRLGRKFPLIVCIDELRIHKSVSEEYSALAKAVAAEHASAIARYGKRQPLTGAVIAVTAMRRAMESGGGPAEQTGANIFGDREAAVAFVTGSA